jgi:hypothetical protein
MGMKPIAPERLEAAQALLRLQMRDKRPSELNVEHAISLHDPIPLLWNGMEYGVKQISYLEGLTAMRFEAMLRRHAEQGDPTTEDGALRRQEDIVEVLTFCWGLLDPMPADNPFLAAAPGEVGQLLRFFKLCLTIQGERSQPMPAPLSRSMH